MERTKKKSKIKIKNVDEVEWKKMGMKTWSLRLRYCGVQRLGTKEGYGGEEGKEWRGIGE